MPRFVYILFFACTSTCAAQEIALTFDDAPTPDGAVFTGDERTRHILDHLERHNVKEAAFFVVTRNITRQGEQRLYAYARAGHLLANHSHSHRWIHQTGSRDYIRDIKTADSVLSSFPGYAKWFRYPFLDEGRSISARDSIRVALRSMNLSNGYVTVDNYDWYLNNLLQKATRGKRKTDQSLLRKIYVDHIYNSILFYDSLARTHLGRSPRHVLLLHENDLTALFLGDLLSHLADNGWKVISPREAYTDPIAVTVPNVLFNGQGRIAAIAREMGITAKNLVQESEDEVYLDKLVEDLKVFE